MKYSSLLNNPSENSFLNKFTNKEHWYITTVPIKRENIALPLSIKHLRILIKTVYVFAASLVMHPKFGKDFEK